MKTIQYSSKGSFPQNTWRCLRFVLLVGIVFSLQQYSFTFLHNHYGYYLGSSGQTAGKQFTQDQPKEHSALLHFLDAEVEVDEKEDDRLFETSPSPFFALFFHAETAFSASLKARFRNSVRFSPKQADRPLFLLHHSWKMHLS